MGPPDRDLSEDDLRNQALPPVWCTGRDKLIEHYISRPFLLRHGHVVWASPIQANAGVFRAGGEDSHATVVFSFQSMWADDFLSLNQLAADLFTLRQGPRYGVDEERFGEMLADEGARALGWRTPKSMTGFRKVYSTMVMIHRDHLPGQKLSASFLPVLAHPGCRAVFVLPKWYWPDPLTTAFRNGWGVA